ncbi:MAG: lysine--tRNA ligase [Candidatus Omnitrophota bacterium]|nr:MAG: lysine--tRNA ligase [Candidatus Omnitrophota bacterium]
MEDIVNIRLNKKKTLEQEGIFPYGRKFNKTDTLKAVVDNYKGEVEVSTAGRVTTIRSHGGSIFCDIKDFTGKLQLYFKKDVLGDKNFRILQQIDIGDIIGVRGKLFKTHRGEITINVSSFSPLSKALRPLPEKWHGLKDIEARYRQRYLDFIANDEVKDIFIFRSRLIMKIRSFFDERGYLEVETPMLQPIPGGAAGKPFKTHHNVYDVDLFMRIAPELYLKRLLVGGLDKVYEINKSFRNEGVSPRHNPEFTMLEAYTAYADYNDMMEITESLTVYLAKELLGKTEIVYKEKNIDLKPPWRRISFARVMKENFNITKDDKPSVWAEKLKAKGVDIETKDISRTKLINIIADVLGPKEDKTSTKPTFVIDYFTELCPLAKTKDDDPSLSERFELYIGGLEIANAYSELNDPIQQRERFKQQIEAKGEGELDEDYVTALEYGMPPAGGLGIGIDRLAMIFTDQESIREVILFPQLKPGK